MGSGCPQVGVYCMYSVLCEWSEMACVIVGRTTHFFGFFTGKQNVSETMPFGENSHSAKFQADISNSF